MKICLSALIIVLLTLLLPLNSTADVYKVGDSFVGFSASDQKGANVTFKAGDAKCILFDSPAEGGQSQSPQDPNFFSENHAFLVINISGFSAIKRKIARSRLESKPFKLLVVEDKGVAAKFPTEKGKFTVLELDGKGVITGIKYAAPGPELKEVVTGTQK